MESIFATFREVLEIAIIVILSLKIVKENAPHLEKWIYTGTILGISLTFVLGGLFLELIEKLELESIILVIVPVLILSFVIWAKLTEIKPELLINLPPIIIIGFIALSIFREGFELISLIYALKGNISELIIGVISAIIVSLAFYYSIIKWSNIKLLLNLSMVILIIIASSMFAEGVIKSLEIHQSAFLSIQLLFLFFYQIILKLLRS